MANESVEQTPSFGFNQLQEVEIAAESRVAAGALHKITQAQSILRLIDFCNMGVENQNTLWDERNDAMFTVNQLLDDAFIPLAEAVEGVKG